MKGSLATHNVGEEDGHLLVRLRLGTPALLQRCSGQKRERVSAGDLGGRQPNLV